MKTSLSTGAVKCGLSFIWVALAALTYFTSEARAQTTGLTKLLSQPIVLPAGSGFKSSPLDEIADTVFMVSGTSGLPTVRRFSELYSDLLYDKRSVVSRWNYPQEEAELSRAGRVLFTNWRRTDHRLGRSVWISAADPKRFRLCSAPAATRQTDYTSSIRVFDRVVDFHCVYNVVSDIERRPLQVFLRETEHSNGLILHAAQELFLSAFNRDARHSFESLKLQEFKFKPGAEDLNVTYEQVLVGRDWLDQTYWNLAKTAGFRMLRNEYAFNGMQESRPAIRSCFIRELSLICMPNNANRVCRIDVARCEDIPDELLE